ncbi:MAG: hypothetical protein LUG18_12220 [Candidatus Azobacteroides sp.]|nr:hypothetical protein [Candidatus Azobacteroides sp.]
MDLTSPLEQIMFEKDDTKILLMYSKKRLNIYTSFDPFLQESFIEKIKTLQEIHIKIICSAGIILTHIENMFDLEGLIQYLEEIMECSNFKNIA